MSNCVNIYTDIIVNPDHIDIPRLLSDMKANDHVNDSGFDKFFAPEATTEEFYFYWFLGEDNFYEDDGVYVLSLGNHRSGHTWRDLGGLELFLGRYLLTPEGSVLQCPCRMSDEYDMHDQIYDGKFTIRRES